MQGDAQALPFRDGAFDTVVSGLVFCALIPGLSVTRGPESWLILSGIGSSVPFGPWNMGVLWVVVRGWGVATLGQLTLTPP